MLLQPWPAVRTIRKLAIQRAQLKEFLSTNKNMSSGQYLRLTGLAGVEVLGTVPPTTCLFASNLAAGPLSPYVNWSHAHDNFDEILQLPSFVWRQGQAIVTNGEIYRYLAVVYAFVFFAFFGLADEAKNYRLTYLSVAKWTGLSTRSMSATGTWTANEYVNKLNFHLTLGGLISWITALTQTRLTTAAQTEKRDLMVSLPDYGSALLDVNKGSFSRTVMSLGLMSKELLLRSPVHSDSVALPTLSENTLDRNLPDAPSTLRPVCIVLVNSGHYRIVSDFPHSVCHSFGS